MGFVQLVLIALNPIHLVKFILTRFDQYEKLSNTTSLRCHCSFFLSLLVLYFFTKFWLLQEMISRSTLENSKLDLMAQISELRSRLSITEIEKRDIQERNRKLEVTTEWFIYIFYLGYSVEFLLLEGSILTCQVKKKIICITIDFLEISHLANLFYFLLPYVTCKWRLKK